MTFAKTAVLANTADFLVIITAFLTALIVQPGEPGSVDTARRLQVAHAFWTAAPPFPEDDDPALAIPGRNGRLYPGYGMGQSLLMLPADIIATAITTSLPARFAHDGLRKAMVTYSASSIVCVLAVWVAFRFLRRMGFVLTHAIAGALTLLFGTTFLHYTQNMMENNLLLLLTLSGISFHYAWTQTGSRLSLFVGALAFGANLLTRLTTVFDLAAGALFVALVLWLKGARGRGFMRQLWRYGAICLPCYAFSFIVDRAYN